MCAWLSSPSLPGGGRFFQMRQRGLGAEKHRARIDALHQVVARRRGLLDVCQVDRAGVVNQRIQPAEALDRRRDGCRHLFLLADIDFHGERLTAGCLHLRGGLVDRAREFRVRRSGLRSDDDVGTFARQPHGDGFADAAARAGDEDCPVGKKFHKFLKVERLPPGAGCHAGRRLRYFSSPVSGPGSGARLALPSVRRK